MATWLSELEPSKEHFDAALSRFKEAEAEYFTPGIARSYCPPQMSYTGPWRDRVSGVITWGIWEPKSMGEKLMWAKAYLKYKNKSPWTKWKH